MATNPEKLPPELQRLVDDLEKNEEGARKAMAGLTPAQLNWQPKEGKGWSILQCLEHLTLSNRLYLDAIRPVVKSASRTEFARRATFQPGMPARFFLSTLEPPVKLKGPAPRAIQPASNGVPERVLAAWLESHEALRQLAMAAAPLDLDLVSLKNPFFRFVSMKLGTALLILPAHERRHLWQAGNVRETMAAGGG